MARYDLIVIGGGLAGAALARAMAAGGARVLVLERELRFRDRVRGEGMHPWGVAVDEVPLTGARILAAAPGGGEAREGTLMERSRLIWIGLFVGSAVGGYVPALWGAGMLSFSSVIGSAIGGVAGIWLGYRLGE